MVPQLISYFQKSQFRQNGAYDYIALTGQHIPEGLG